MSGYRAGFVLIIIVVMSLTLSACEEERYAILDPHECEDCDIDGITGTVFDRDREPVAAVAIGLVYMLEGVELPGDWDPDKPQTQITFDLGEIDPVSVVILDNAGEPVRTLVDETTEEIPEVIIWDATDDDGRLVPVGLYLMRAILADSTLIERVIFNYDHDIPAFLDKPNAVTNEEGDFRVPRNLIPVGAEIPVYDEMGGFLGLHAVLPQIMVLAVIEHEGTLYHLAREVTLTQDDSRVAVEFLFPFDQR